MTGKVLAVVGGQYGSEGKGVVVNHLADHYAVHVRVGGPNAGHSFWYQHSEGQWSKQVMQMLPCGWTNPEATLVIGPGAVVDLQQLAMEVQRVEERYDPNIRGRVLIAEQAFVLEQRHHEEEGGTKGELHQRIGSTGHGVGAARHDRMSRDPERGRRVGSLTRRNIQELGLQHIGIAPRIPQFLLEALGRGENILLEGTQGSALSLTHGPWPYVTSADTNAAQLAADSGLAPQLVDDVLLVCRTYPIRVAGNSGPLRNEITWEELSKRLGRPVEEITTVTKKVRRIGEWDEDLVLKAVTLNQPSSIALTFLDYISPEDEGKDDFYTLSRKSRSFIEYVETTTGVPVSLVGTGGQHWSIIDRGTL